MSFGKTLIELRKIKNISQNELAEAIGVTARTVRSWEKEGRFPTSQQTYINLSKTLNCDIKKLMTSDLCDMDEDKSIHITPKAILEAASALFAGGHLSDDDKLKFLNDVQSLYIDSKNRVRNNEKGDI